MLFARKNKLLETLPSAVYQNWKSRLSIREFKKGAALDMKGARGEVYFPISCVIAIYVTAVSGRKSFMRFVGPNFAAGLVNMMATDSVIFDGRICGAGYALAIPSEVVLRSIESPSLSGGAQSIAMARTAKGGLAIAHCLGSHTNKQRLATLLLQAYDCFGAERPITLTQKSLGEMLMVRRERAAEILALWVRDGVMESRRGALHLRNPQVLASFSCDCYRGIRQSYLDELKLWRSIRWYGA